MHTSHPNVPSQSEGDINSTPRRAAWQHDNLDAPTRALLARDSDAFLHQSVSTPCLNGIAKAEGLWITDTAGRRYMDFHGNNVHHVGYAHPHVVAAIKAQLDALSFAPRRYACERSVELAEALGAQFRRLSGHAGRVLFTTGGSDAVEVAIKLARAATGRFKTLSFWDAFHGAGFGASSVGGESLFRGGRVGPLLPGTEHVAPFGCYRCAYGHPVDATGQPDLERCRLACVGMVRYVLEREGDVAAVVAEPARAVPYVPPPGYWQAVQDACRAHGTLLIFDETPTGLRKAGRFFAAGHAAAEPEIGVLGELEVIEREGLVEQAARVGAHALERLYALKDRHPLIGDVRGRGLLLGLELVSDRACKTPAGDAAEAVLYRALSRGLSFKTTMGNTLTLTPPLITTREQMDDAIDILDTCLAEVTG